MSTPERPTKRARQACEPCRRKKSRCPGEKPICSHCARLRQVCTYARERGDSEPQDDLQLDVAANAEAMTAERLKMLERGMAQIQSVLSGQVVAMEPSRNAEIPPRQPVRSNEHHSLAMPSSGNAGGPPESEIEAAAVLYLKFCDCQPLPLFSMHEWAEGLQLREPEVVLAVVALANRFDTAEKTYLVTKRHLYMEQARSLVLQRLISGPIEISTIQTLCLLSLVYFNESATARASSFSALACDLAQSAGLATELPGAQPASSREERRRCYWSLTLLRNLFGNMNGNIAFISTDFPPQYPKSAEPPAKSSLNITEPGLPQPDGPLDNANNASSEADHGIMATVVSLSAVWIKTVRYVCRRGKSQRLPSWVPESEYQQILTELMTIESHMPYKYRYKPARFDEYNDDELQQSRTFWAPWLLNQILYHSILCLLNHPLILSLHLRNLRMTMVPEIFLQHTDDLIQTHTSWVVHLVDQILAKDFRLTDPYPPYCVGIVATIFLQQSYSDDERVRANKQENFTKCLRFVRQAGNYWPRVATLADKVEQFQQVVTHSSRTASDGDSRSYIDLTLFWEILESCFIHEPLAEGYFGQSLVSHRSRGASSEIVNGRLLPAPTRLDPSLSAANTPTVRATVPGTNQYQPNPGPTTSIDDQLQVLAQSYFAQGQDFLNLDDWWYPEPQLP